MKYSDFFIYVLYLISPNIVLSNNYCNPYKGAVTYSKWLGGRNGTHSNSDTLISQLINLDNTYAKTHPNLTIVFQTQLTETKDDIIKCSLSTLKYCPTNFKCILHILGLYKEPALEYWQYECHKTQYKVTKWYKCAAGIPNIQTGCNNYDIQIPNNNINILLVDYYNTYFGPNSLLYEISMYKNLLLAPGCNYIDSNDSSNWMSKLVQCSKKRLYLFELTTIGAHDAATYIIYNNSRAISEIYINKLCKDNPIHCDLITNIGQSPVRSFAATQSGYNFFDILNNGARYLDLRIIPVLDSNKLTIPKNTVIKSKNQIDIYFSHNFVLLNLSFKEGLEQVVSFVDNHPREVVMLYLSHYDGGIYDSSFFENILPYFNNKLVSIVQEVLGDRIILNCFNTSFGRLPSIQDIYNNRAQRGGVLLFYKSNHNLLEIKCPVNISCPIKLFWNAIGAS